MKQGISKIFQVIGMAMGITACASKQPLEPINVEPLADTCTTQEWRGKVIETEVAESFAEGAYPVDLSLENQTETDSIILDMTMQELIPCDDEKGNDLVQKFFKTQDQGDFNVLLLHIAETNQEKLRGVFSEEKMVDALMLPFHVVDDEEKRKMVQEQATYLVEEKYDSDLLRRALTYFMEDLFNVKKKGAQEFDGKAFLQQLFKDILAPSDNKVEHVVDTQAGAIQHSVEILRGELSEFYFDISKSPEKDAKRLQPDEPSSMLSI